MESTTPRGVSMDSMESPSAKSIQEYTNSLVAAFQANGVTVSPPAGFQDLNLLYNQAHTVFIPAPVEGGGERAVLEARAAGVAVEVAVDNPKLQVTGMALMCASHSISFLFCRSYCTDLCHPHGTTL
jgi:hypothetical protein